MTSTVAYLGVVAAVGLLRLVELHVARRNGEWARARGGVEFGRGHYPFMVALHTALLVGCVAEVLLLDRPFLPWLGWPMLALLVASSSLRWWCIRTLGPQWNTRVLVVPGLPLVTGGPYRWLRHPNYVAVVTEVAALPLVHSAWMTAAVVSVLNLALLTVRIRVEDGELEQVAGPRR